MNPEANPESTFLSALIQFTLQFLELEKINYEPKSIIFVTASAIAGFVIMLLDFGGYFLKGTSFLGMSYNRQSKWVFILIVWTFAAAAVSYLGLIMKIFNSTIQSCVVVGASWIFLAARIANQNTPDNNEIQR